MKTFCKTILLAGLSLVIFHHHQSHGATVILNDTVTVTGSGSGFALNTGINTGINPPTTRLTGTAAPNLRYINTGTKATTNYNILNSRMRVGSGANPGRFVLSANGTTAFDFGPALGIGANSPGSPAVYDLSVSMKNSSTGTQRFSFAIGSAEGDATTWDFGFQVYRNTATDTFYTIGKRIDTAASGLASDLNSAILTMGAGTFGSEITFLMRITDAGAETTTFNSRVQLSTNSGSTWFYDTATDANLTSGWRFDGPARIIMMDIAPDAGDVTYDNFSVTWNSGPRLWTGAGANNNWSNPTNWGGATPVNGSALIFNGSAQLSNVNDLTGLTVPRVVFNNGGFTLSGNTFTNSGTVISNLAGNNILKAGLSFSSTAAKTWSIASGSELMLSNTTTVAVTGDHSVIGGGVLRTKGTMNFTANPVFAVNEGKHIVDGGIVNTIGGYRIGSQATGAGAQTILTNGASLTVTATGGSLRVGDSANPVAARLDMDSSTLTLSGGVLLAVPYATGAIGTVTQTGGTVSPGILSFSEGGAGTGSYTVKNGTLITKQIRENTPAGSASIYFDNATLRTDTGASNAFMSGLDVAQISSGGLSFDAVSSVIVGQALTGTGSLVKLGAGTLTLSGANTFTGNTTVSTGTLALGTGGSLASPTIALVAGSTYNVSAITGYALTSSQTLSVNSVSGAANVNGSLTLNSGAQISLQANGTFGTLSVTGGLTVNGNVININVAGSALSAGTYTLITYTGTKTGSFNVTPTITGSGLGANLMAKIVESAGTISLYVSPSGHGIAAANIKVVENDLANTTNSVTVSTSLSINGLGVRAGSSRGDYTVQVGTTGTDDLTNGVLMTSVAENGRDNGEDAGIEYCTSSISFTSGGYFIPTASAPDGAEYNINVAAAYFPYAKYLGGYARNAGGTNGPNNLLTASPGLILGTHFIDNGDGTSTVNLTGLGINSQTDGVLLATAGGNDNKYATVRANTNGTWTLLVKDNATDGATPVEDPVAFAFVPKANTAVVSGKFQGDGTILMYSGSSPAFSVTNTTNGTWKLTIPGYSPSKGVLVITGEGGTGLNSDNIVSAQGSGNDWLIQSRDLPGLGLQVLTEPVASFVFIPGPIATLVSPANNANISTAPTLAVTATSPAGGNLSIRFTGERLAVPGPGPDFLMCVLPDTQNYAREDSANGQATKEMWYAQTDWIVNHRDSDNIAYVQQLGDIVQNGDSNSQSEWDIATNAMYRLEKQSTTLRLEGIPYSCDVGNHDQTPNGDLDGTTTHYNKYFGISHFTGRSYYGGHYDTNNDNHFELFSAGGLDFLVICFEFDRYGSLVLDWAQSVIDAHPNRRIIFATHYIGSDSTPSNLSPSGDAFYARFKANTNFFLMMGGHVFNGGGEGSRSDTFGGHTVHTLVSDYQGRFNGGNGLMRLMYFSPASNIVNIKTFSPYTGVFETDADSQFSFSYNMQPNGAGVAGTAYSTLATVTNVAPGAQANFNWTGLTANRTYQWYVTVTAENGDYSTSPEWTFNTTATYSGLVATQPTDANNNGLPDAWEAQYGVTNPLADDDHDGVNNRAEYLAGTNPTNAASVFRIMEANQSTDGHVTIRWSSVGGVRYRIQYSDGAGRSFTDIARDPSEETDSHPVGDESTSTYTDTLAPTNEARFYRIKIIR